MQILSTSPLVSIVSRWNLSSDHRHNGHKLNFPIEKRVVIYYTCCLSFSHFQLYAIEFILLYFTQHLITLLLSAFQQHNMWGVAFLFLFKAFFFCVLLLSILLFLRPWRRLHSHPELSSWISLLSHFSPERGWNQTVFHFSSFAHGCATPPPDYSSPALAYYSLSVCVVMLCCIHEKGFRKPPKVFMFKRATHIKTASVSLTECSSFHQPVFGQDRTPRWHASPIYEGLVILDSSARRSAAGGYKHGVSVPLHSCPSTYPLVW